MKILWAALLASVFVYAGILLALRNRTPAPHPPDPVMLWGFAATALSSLVMSVWLPHKLRRQMLPVAAAKLATREVFAEQLPGGAGLRDAPSATRVFADPAAADAVAYGTAMTPMILTCALRESVAIFGLVLGILHHPPTAWAPFLVVGALGIALEMPTHARIRGALTWATGIGYPAT